MAEVNEEIAKAYFEEVCGYLTKSDYCFQKTSKRPHKRGGVGPSDIDLLIMHPNEGGLYGKRAMVSVKGWHDYILTKYNCKTKESWTKGFEKQDLDAAEEFFKTKDFSKILVVPRVEKNNREFIEKYVKTSKGIDCLIDFPFMINEIFKKFKKPRYYKESEVLQTLAVAYRHNIKSLIKENEELREKLENLQR